MKINRIIFENFMPYQGTATLDLTTPSSTPIVLILGENGFGKTSIHHAIRWCLYGQTRPLKSDEVIPTYKLLNWKTASEFENIDERNPQYRSAHLAVQVEFEHLGEHYELKRSHKFKGSDYRGEQEVSLRIGDGNYVSGAKIDEIVQSILPRELSQFFLFDGEVLDRFEEMRTQDQQAKFIKQQIESTLGIPKLKQAIQWIETKKDEQVKILKKSENLSKKDADLQERIANDEDKKRVKESERAKLLEGMERDRLEAEQLKVVLGNYEIVRADLEKERDLKVSLKNEEKVLVEALSVLRSFNKEYFWSPVAKELLGIVTQLSSKKPTIESLTTKANSLKSTIEMQKKFLDEGLCPLCGSSESHSSEKLNGEIQQLDAQLSSLQQQLLHESQDYVQDYEDLVSILDFSQSNYSSAKDTYKKVMKSQERIARLKMDLQNVLERSKAGFPDGDQSSKVTRYETLTRGIAQDEMILADLEREVEELRSRISTNRAQIAKTQVNSSTPAKVLKFYSGLSPLLEKTMEIYAQNVRRQVETEASAVFSKIISEKDFNGLQINPSFGMDIKRKDGSLVNLRSEGQAHIAAISLVAGLLRTAIKDGFILMDTPFGRLDMTHRENICGWIVNSGLQVALFVHSGEFRLEEHLPLLSGRVGRKYQISRIDSNRSEFREVN